MFTRAGDGGIAPVVRVWWAGGDIKVKVDIKSFQTKVKASKSIKQLQRYGHFKFGQFSPQIPALPEPRDYKTPKTSAE